MDYVFVPLIKAGARVDTPNNDGYSPLDFQTELFSLPDAVDSFLTWHPHDRDICAAAMGYCLLLRASAFKGHASAEDATTTRCRSAVLLWLQRKQEFAYRKNNLAPVAAEDVEYDYGSDVSGDDSDWMQHEEIVYGTNDD